MKRKNYDPTWIKAKLAKLGFEVEVNETSLVAFREIRYEGTLRLSIDLADLTLSLHFMERFAKQTLLFNQAFANDEQLMGLLTGNYLFDELVISRTPDCEQFLDAVLAIQAKWTEQDKGDIAILIDAINAATRPLFADNESAPQPLN
ncbi:hypothetical protein [Spirosoma pomorum]